MNIFRRLLALLMLAGIADTSALAQDHFIPFRGKPDNDSGIKLIGADAEQLVTFEPTGMRITLTPPKHHQAVGVSTGLRVKGDFEITLSFEILKEEPQPEKAKGGSATRLRLFALLDRPQGGDAGFARKITEQRGPSYLGWTALWDDALGKLKTRSTNDLGTVATSGRLRMVRTGAELAFFASDGPAGDFTLLKQLPFGTEDLKDVQITANTGGPKGALDVRVSDLRVRMNIGAQAAAAPAARATPAGSLAAVLVLALVALLAMAGVLGLLVYLRQRRHVEPAAEALPVDDEQGDLKE